MGAAKSTVSSVLDDIKGAFSSKLESAKSTVSSVIEKIKGVFNFKWSLPHLNLPHISVNGGKAPYGIGGKGSLPSFSIEWYKNGGIMTNPTVFGINGNSLMVRKHGKGAGGGVGKLFNDILRNVKEQRVHDD